MAAGERRHQVLAQLAHRAAEPAASKILIACVDDLKGFPEAISAAFPKTQVQLCIVHMARNSMKYVPWKDYKEIAADLKLVYGSKTEDKGRLELERFAEKRVERYPQINRPWQANWENIRTLFAYPDEIRRTIYTTNAIESLYSVIRKATKQRKLFPTDASALKVIYLAISEAAKKWTMPVRNWKSAGPRRR